MALRGDATDVRLDPHTCVKEAGGRSVHWLLFLFPPVAERRLMSLRIQKPEDTLVKFLCGTFPFLVFFGVFILLSPLGGHVQM